VLGGSVKEGLSEYITKLNPTFWLQADEDDNALYTDDAAIATGYDKSTNQLDVVQSTAEEKPTYKTGILNGLPVFRFDGGDSLVKADVARTTVIPNADQTSLILVMFQNAAQANNCPFFWGDGNLEKVYGALLSFGDTLYFDVGNQTAGQGRVSVAQPAGWDDAWHIVEMYKRTDAKADMIVDGVTIIDGAAQTKTFTTDPTSNLTVGKIGTVIFSGDIYLILSFRTSLTAAERLKLRNYIKDKTSLLALSLSSPTEYSTYQRVGTTGDILIEGSITGALTSRTIEASFNGGDYQDIATGIMSSFSGTLTNQTNGQGTLTVRIKGTSITSTVANVGIGDIFIVAGQSNALGQGINNQSYTHATLKAAKYTRAGAWADCTDPVDSLGHGSVWVLIANKYLTDMSIPCAFVPCGVDGSAISTWSPSGDNYNAMKTRALTTGAKTILFWQGESDVAAGTAEATYNAALDAIANQINSDLSVKLMPCKLQDCTDLDETAVNNAIGTAWVDNDNVLAGADLHGIATDDTYHLKTDEKLESAAVLLWAAIKTAFGWT